MEQHRQVQRAPARLGKLSCLRLELLIHSVHLVHRRVPELRREPDLPRHHVAAIREHLQLTNGAPAIIAAGAHDPVHEVDDPRSTDQGILAGRWWGGAGMAVLPRRNNVVPDLRLRAGYDTDLLVLPLQERTLLDMQLEI